MMLVFLGLLAFASWGKPLQEPGLCLAEPSKVCGLKFTQTESLKLKDFRVGASKGAVLSVDQEKKELSFKV